MYVSEPKIFLKLERTPKKLQAPWEKQSCHRMVIWGLWIKVLSILGLLRGHLYSIHRDDLSCRSVREVWKFSFEKYHFFSMQYSFCIWGSALVWMGVLCRKWNNNEEKTHQFEYLKMCLKGKKKKGFMLSN